MNLTGPLSPLELLEGDDIGMLRHNFGTDVAAVATRRAELESIAVGGTSPGSSARETLLAAYKVLATEPWRDADGYEIGRLPGRQPRAL
eukprot:COSAG06_NODE_3910_length_4781_cov_15.115984_2_plen_89_part_00